MNFTPDIRYGGEMEHRHTAYSALLSTKTASQESLCRTTVLWTKQPPWQLLEYIRLTEPDLPASDFGSGPVYPANVYWRISDKFTDYVNYQLDEEGGDQLLIDMFNEVIEQFYSIHPSFNVDHELPDYVEVENGGQLIYFIWRIQ